MSAPNATTIFEIKPTWAFIVLRRLGWLALCAAIGTAGLAAYLDRTLGSFGLWAAVGSLAAALAILLYSRFERDGETYRLSNSLASWESGILRRLCVEAPLARIQHAVLYRSIRERCFGLGTIGLATAGSDAIEIVWRMIDDPQGKLDTVRSAISEAIRTAPGASESPVAGTSGSASQSVPIIGLAGGIGAGKSTVGRMLASMGCLVIDSDQRARVALDRPDVRDQLVSWWGGNILTSKGTVDRSKVAAIVFSDAQQRARLESLVHPIVRQDRAAMIAEAAASGKPPRAVVIDAPLLFEVGLDKECDATVFIDTPAELRKARVLASRGWTEEDLRRREVSQLPLEEKRSRASFVVDNSGAEAELEARLATVLTEVTKTSGSPAPRPPVTA